MNYRGQPFPSWPNKTVQAIASIYGWSAPSFTGAIFTVIETTFRDGKMFVHKGGDNGTPSR